MRPLLLQRRRRAEDQTEVLCNPNQPVPTWLAAEQANDLEEERLYGNERNLGPAWDLRPSFNSHFPM